MNDIVVFCIVEAAGFSISFAIVHYWHNQIAILEKRRVTVEELRTNFIFSLFWFFTWIMFLIIYPTERKLK